MMQLLFLVPKQCCYFSFSTHRHTNTLSQRHTGLQCTHVSHHCLEPRFHALVSSPAECAVPVWLEQETASALWFIIDVREDQIRCTLAREKMRVLEGTASSCWRSWVSAQAFLSGSRGTKPSTDRWHILKAFCTLSSNVRPTAITCIQKQQDMAEWRA